MSVNFQGRQRIVDHAQLRMRSRHLRRLSFLCPTPVHAHPALHQDEPARPSGFGARDVAVRGSSAADGAPATGKHLSAGTVQAPRRRLPVL